MFLCVCNINASVLLCMFGICSVLFQLWIAISPLPPNLTFFVRAIFAFYFLLRILFLVWLCLGNNFRAFLWDDNLDAEFPELTFGNKCCKTLQVALHFALQ